VTVPVDIEYYYLDAMETRPVQFLVNGKLIEGYNKTYFNQNIVITPFYHFQGCILYDKDGYFSNEKRWEYVDAWADHPSSRMMSYQIAIEYAESMIEKEEKAMKENGEYGFDPAVYADIVPNDSRISRLGTVTYFKEKLNELQEKRANYIRMETSLYPPYWLVRLRQKLRDREEATQAASRYRSDYFSRDSDIVLRPLLDSNSQDLEDEVSTQKEASV
jgi:hypothetical protein